MTTVLEQDVSTSASIGSFGGTVTSNTSTNNLYLEKIWFNTLFRSQSITDYLDNKERSQSNSSIRTLTNDISVKKITFTLEVDLALFEWVLSFFRLKPIPKRSGLTQETVLRRLDELKNLPEDWDSYGADTISEAAIAKAKSVIASVTKAFGGIIGTVVQLTDIIPTADGGIQLEWVGPHAELEIEISSHGEIGLLYISSIDRNDYEESENNTFQDVYAMIAKLIHSQYSS
jgi:hypothetical protein